MFGFIILVVAVGTVSAAPASSQISKSGRAEKSLPLPSSSPETSLRPASSAPSSPVSPPSIEEPSPAATTPEAVTVPRSPVLAPKALAFISETKTPASTVKLAHLIAPLATSAVAAPLLTPHQISEYAYVAPALDYLLEHLAASPSSYSVEQHGYRITY